ncbi:MAG: HNH endonuclease [Coriobacteriaceae bacterium]|nr:HNH endonuclease [Coriobacteriaceae bacterium]
MPRRNWTPEETHMAFALYLLLEPSQISKTNADVISFANAIGRSPSSVALKLWNISAYDLNRVETGRVGMRHGNKLDRLVWEEYNEGGEDFLAASVDQLKETATKHRLEFKALKPVYAEIDSTPVGKERTATVKQRVNQRYFRNSLLKVYEGRCCITGISAPNLLIASHIKPWAFSDNATEKLSPTNGLLLNALHDRAFDQGLMTVTPDYRIHVSKYVKHNQDPLGWLWQFDKQEISLPKSHAPNKELLLYHNDEVFKG